MTATTGLRERKKSKVREAILEAALDLCERQGFEHTTVEEIADRCEISPRTFFRYFPNKESVLLGDSENGCAELTAALVEQPVDVAPMQAIHAAIIPVLAEIQDDREHFSRRMRVLDATPGLRADRLTSKERWRRAIVEVLTARETAGTRPVSRLGLNLVAASALAAVQAAVDTWLEEEGDLLEIVDRAFTAVVAGLR